MDSLRARGARVLQVAIWAALAVVLVGTVLEAAMDYFEISLDAGTLAQTFVQSPQAVGVVLVAVEESGLPLPISGDLLIMYSTSGAASNPAAWLLLAVAFEVAVLLGSSLLYFIARRWGTSLLFGAPGKALHLTPERIKRVEGWFKRWGIWAVIFGRYIPGFRVAVTVVAASFELGYRVFIAGVAISAAVWISAFIALGLLVGPRAEQLLSAHQVSSYTILGVAAVVGILYIAGRAGWRRLRRVAT